MYISLISAEYILISIRKLFNYVFSGEVRTSSSTDVVFLVACRLPTCDDKHYTVSVGKCLPGFVPYVRMPGGRPLRVRGIGAKWPENVEGGQEGSKSRRANTLHQV